MQRRERILVIVLGASLALGVVGPKIRDWVLQPVDSRQATITSLDRQISDRQDELDLSLAKLRQMKDWKDRSLPANPQNAALAYQQWLTELAESAAGFADVKVEPNPATPVRGSTFVGVKVTVKGAATLDQLRNFLYLFYRADLLHRIVFLKVDSQGNRGNPALNVTLQAEGLSLRDAPNDGANLFPRTELAAAVKKDARTLTVADPSIAPDGANFRIRIGGEYLTVKAATGTAWTVERGVDFTASAEHPQGAVVELAPLHPEMAGRKPEDYESLLALNPFAKPTPPRTYRPRFDRLTDRTLIRGEPLRFRARVSDIDPAWGRPEFRLSNAAEGMEIDAESGEFVWEPSSDQAAGSYRATIQAVWPEDGRPPLSETVRVTLREPNKPPVLESIADREVTIGNPLAFQVKASDPDQPRDTLSFSLGEGAPSGAAIDSSTGEFRWTPSENVLPGDYKVTIQVSDNGTPRLTDSKTVSIKVLDDLAQFTRLTGIVGVGNDYHARLYDVMENKLILLKEGSALNYGGVKGEVVEIGSNYLILQKDDGAWRLKLGENLHSLQKTAGAKAD